MTLDEFVAAWHCLVSEWHAARLDPDGKPARVLRRALRHGLTPLGPEESSRATPTDPVTAGMSRGCELAVLRMSGALRPKAYTKANRDVAKRGLDPLEHFVDQGWRRLRNPSREFDVWWYWSEYLDPSHDSVNPLLHYLLVGRHVGHEPVPPVEVPSSPTSFPEGSGPRRICLFAGYDPHGVVDDCVVAYVRELSRFADVYYLADGYMLPGELEKLHIAQGAWARSHGAYDFGSYSLLARELVGWDVIDGYDELLLVNDSGFLLRPLEPVFREMDARTCDWWGLQATRHDFDQHSNGGRPLPLETAKSTMIGERTMEDMDHLHVSSYFLAFRRRAHSDPGFRKRLDKVTRQEDKHLVIYKYEIGLSRFLMCRGYEVDTFIPDLYPFHPLYTEQYFELLAKGFPLLKRNFLSENSRDVPDLAAWKQRILAVVPGAPVDMMERNLHRVVPDDRLRRSFAIRTDECGDIEVTRPFGSWQIVDQDRLTPTYDYWWGFPVDVETERLSSDQRAVFEAVRDDPTIRKVILSRGVPVDVPGCEVEAIPLRSLEGQEAAMRCGTLFVAQSPRVSVPFPLSPRRHRFVLVDSASRHEARTMQIAPQDPDARTDVARLRHAVAASSIDAMVVASLYSPMPLDAVVVTGAPRHDLLHIPRALLGADLQAMLRFVDRVVGGRKLLMLSLRPGSDLIPVLPRLVDVADAAGWVVGFQDRAGDRSFEVSRALSATHAVRFDRADVPYPEMLYRSASLVVGDDLDAVMDFIETGRPAIALRSDEAVSPHGCRQGARLEFARQRDDLVRLVTRVVEQVGCDGIGRATHGRNARTLTRWIRSLDVGGSFDPRLSAVARPQQGDLPTSRFP